MSDTVTIPRALLQQLIDVGSKRTLHDNAGLCPDSIEGHDTRDTDCPACQALIAADAALAGTTGAAAQLVTPGGGLPGDHNGTKAAGTTGEQHV